MSTSAPYNILSNLKVAVKDLPRNVFLPENGKDTGFIYNTFQGTERQPFMGLDISISNQSGGTATISIDGQRFVVIDTTIKNLNDYPFSTIEIISAGATPSQIDIIVAGCSYDILKKYAPVMRDNIWA